MKTISKITIVLLVCTLLSGCATMSDQSRTRAEGSAAGAVLGGLLGLAVGDGKGAAIGALAGAGVGFLVGNEVAKRKQAYANTEEFLDAEIATTQEYNTTTAAYNRKVARELAALEKESATLKARYDKGKVSRQTLTAKRDTLQKRIAQSRQLEETLSKELEVQTAILEQESKKRPEGDAYIARLEKEVAALQKNLATLRNDSTQLASIDQRLSV
ncbi:MAG TPA: glycine zipper domain-containing protein [Desulfomicrobiaceae bacterium]|nr:glycine zipper domain-containing protein [Desulfomicrobiaceae bacterium]